MEFTGYIYHPNFSGTKMILEEKLFWNGMLIGGLCLIILILIESINKPDWIELILKWIAGIAIITGFLARFLAIGKKKPLNGKLKGTLIINPKFIEFNGRRFEVDSIKKLDLELIDYSGKFHAKPFYPGPWGSNGTRNKVGFWYNNERLDHYFQIRNQTEFKTLQGIKAKLKHTVANNV